MLMKKSSGSTDAPATPLTEPCEYNCCPTGSPAEGNNASDPRLNYVNSYPVTSMRYGIQTLSPKFFGSAPDIAVAGFNVGGKASHPSRPVKNRNPSDNLRFSKPRKHRPCIRNRRSSDGGIERGYPRHRLQRHHRIADRVHGARADIHDRIRRSINKRDP